MNEKRKIWVLIIAVLVIAGILVVSIIDKNNNSAKMYKVFEDKMASSDIQLIYIGRPTCGYCQNFQPKLDNLANSYNFSYQYINIDALNSTAFYKLLDKLGLAADKFGTPYTIIVKNNQIIARQDGDTETEKELFTFLQTNGIIASNATYTGTTGDENLTYITATQLQSLVTATTNSVVVVIQKGCGYCAMAKPVLNEITKEKQITINLIEYGNVTAEVQQSIRTSIPYLSQNDWGTPITFLVGNGQAKLILEGAGSKDKFLKAFTENGVIK